MKSIRSLSVSFVVLLHLCGPPPLQPQQNEGETFKISVHSQLVEVFLTVARGKELIPNLAKSDFTLSEDGMPVAVDRLDNLEVPLQVVLAVDLSESVRPSLRAIQEASIAFLDSLKPKDRVTLILFNSEIQSFHQKTDDRDPIVREINRARARGMTRLYDSMILGMKLLEGKSGRKALVCFTDGQDTSGTLSGTAALNAAARFGYPIYMIGAGAGLELDSSKILLRQFAEVNSGRAFFIQSIHKLRDAFHDVAEELRSAYVLNYYTNVAQDGRWHNLSVGTFDPSYTVHSRKGFFSRREPDGSPKP
jgi:VWFA-related protein